MPNKTISYVRKIQPNSHDVRWAFERNGHRVRLPAQMREPWYSRDYADALVQSGMSEVNSRKVIQALPHSLSAALLAWRQSEAFLSLSQGSRRRLARAADRLCRTFGWADTRYLTEEIRLAMLPDGEDGAGDVLRVLNCALGKESTPGANKRLTETDLSRLLGVLPIYSPERVALMLMVHTGENLKSAVQITPSDPRTYSALWKCPALVKELPFPAGPDVSYVDAAGGKGNSTYALERRIRVAAAGLGVPVPNKVTLRDLSTERVADAIVRHAA